MMRNALVILGTLAIFAAIGLVTWVVASPDDEPERETDSITLAIVISDNLPESVYFGDRDGVCKPVTVEAPTITIKDSNGTIVASESAPAGGGELFRRAGCFVEVRIQVPQSDFYEVSLGGPISETQSVKFVESGQEVVFDV